MIKNLIFTFFLGSRGPDRPLSLSCYESMFRALPAFGGQDFSWGGGKTIKSRTVSNFGLLLL